MTKSLPYLKSVYIFGAILGASFLLVAVLLTANAAAGPAVVPSPTVWLQVPPQPVDNNSEITVSIRISDAVNLFGAELVIDFDPDALQVIDQDANKPGFQIEPADCPVDDFALTNAADNSAGSIAYAVTQLNPTPPVNGDCSVANIYFMTKKEMTTTLSFGSVILSNPDGVEIPSGSVGAEMEIAGGDVAIYLPVIIK